MSGVSTTAIQIGGSIGVAVLATVAATTARHHAGAAGAAALAAGYTQAFRAGAVIIALAVPLALVFLRLRPGGQPASDGAGTAAAVPDDAAVTRPAVTAPAAAAVTARADGTGAAVASPAAAQGPAVTLPAAVTPAVPRRRLLTRWCPVSATVTEGRDAPGRRMVLPAPPHRADRLASPVLARRGRPDERQPHGSLHQPSPGRRGPGRARGRPAPCGRTPPGNRSQTTT